MRVWLIIPLLLLTACDRMPREGDALTVFAAASLSDVVIDIAERYEKQTGQTVHCHFASTSTLARQIEAGAPADLFLSAHPDWIDYLQDRDLIIASTRIDFAHNRLIIITPKGLGASGALRDILLRGRIAMGDPDHVPAGVYAKQALQSLNLWDDVKDRVIAASDVRGALRLVEMGEAEVGIVYATDVRLTPGVHIAGELPSDAHGPIVYTAAIVRNSHADAAKLLQFITHGESQTLLRDAGFATEVTAR